jgi:hypothetical protein
VIARLGLWFAAHVLFAGLVEVQGPAGLTFALPDWTTFRPAVAALAVVGGVAAPRVGVPGALLACSALAALLHTAGWLG